MRTAIITPSYRNDFELARDLCRSIDAYASGHDVHMLVVPRTDVSLFSELAGPQRQVVTVEEVLGPFGFRRLPLPSRLYFPGLVNRRIREQWWHPSLGRISGWVAQQIVKLASERLTQADVLVFADSDLELFRPMSMSRFCEDQCVVLHQGPMDTSSAEHLGWLHTARRLLGLPQDYGQALDNIGSLVSWRADTLRRLHAHLERVNGRPWPCVVGAERTIAEYLLYGVFCREVLGPKEAGHTACDNGLVHAIWTAGQIGTAEAFAEGLLPTHTTLQIQSTMPLSLPERRQFFEEVRRCAAQADAQSEALEAESARLRA